MSKQSVNQVIQRAISDAAFRRQLQRDPSSALVGLDLSADERAAITSGAPIRLTALGVDQRMSKAFGLGGLSDVSKVVIGDTGSAGSAAFIDEASSAGTGALVTPEAGDGGSAVLSADDVATFHSGLTGTAGPSSSVIVGDPAAATSATVTTPGGPAGGSMDNIADEVPTFHSGLTGTDGASSSVLVGDPGAATSATDTTPDGTAFDAGSVSARVLTDVGDGSASAFETPDASGDLNAFDPGIGGAGSSVVDAGDLGGLASSLDESAIPPPISRPWAGLRRSRIVASSVTERK